jgi:hypothetical protein
MLTAMNKNEAAVSLGRQGGIARAKKLTAKRRKEIASKAAAARWAKDTTKSASKEKQS